MNSVRRDGGQSLSVVAGEYLAQQDRQRQPSITMWWLVRTSPVPILAVRISATRTRAMCGSPTGGALAGAEPSDPFFARSPFELKSWTFHAISGRPG